MANESGPLFELSEDIVLHNLHVKAVEDAAKVCKVASIENDIINSYDDGNRFQVAQGKSGEIAIVKKFQDFHLEDPAKTQAHLDGLKADILKGLKAYLKAFAYPETADALTADDLQMVVANQYGRNLKSNAKENSKSSSKFIPMEPSQLNKFMEDHPKDKPVIGFKITYSLV